MNFVISKKTIEESIFVISMAVAFSGNNLLSVVIGITWILYGIVKKSGRGFLSNKDFRFFLGIYFIPVILIHIYTFFLIVIGEADSSILSTNLITYIPIVLAICVVGLWGFKGCIDVFLALFIIWIVKAGKIIFANGINAIIVSVIAIFSGNLSSNYFEMDDIVLASGYFILMFFVLKNITKKNRVLLTIGLTLIFILGAKRIAFLGVVITFLVHFILKRTKKKNKFRIAITIGLIMAICGLLYVSLFSDDNIISIVVNDLGINMMARNYFYESLLKKGSFSIDFLGLGRGSVKKIMLENFPPFQYVHSDYIKMFIEIGFIPYLLWLIYYFVIIAILVKRRYGEKAAIFMTEVSAYTAVLYMTDNTESYFICGLLRCIIPLAYISYIKYKETNDIRLRHISIRW